MVARLRRCSYMDEGDLGDEEEHWEKTPEFGWSDTMTTMRVQGVDTTKEKVKVRSPKRMDSYKRGDAGLGEAEAAGAVATNLNEDGWGDVEMQGGEAGTAQAPAEELASLLARGEGLSMAESLRVKELMERVAGEEELAALMSKGPDMTAADKERVKFLVARHKASAGGAGGEAAGEDEAALALAADLELERVGKASGIVADLYASSKASKALDSGVGGGGGDDDDDDEEKSDGGAHEDDGDEDDDPAPDEMALALARAEAARRTKAQETVSDRQAAATFSQFSEAGRDGASADAGGLLVGQRVLVQALGACGLDPSADLRVALVVDAFIQVEVVVEVAVC